MRAITATLGALSVLFGIISPTAAQELVLQKLPAVRVPALDAPPDILSLSFDGTDTQVIGHLADGSIYAWVWDGSAPHLIAQTEDAFAYCPAGERMAISAGKAAILLSLRDGGYASLSEGLYDHAAFSKNCGVMVLAETATYAVEHWRIGEAPVLRAAATLQPVRGGIAVAPDGNVFAVATSDDADEGAVSSALEVFQMSEDGSVRRAARVEMPGAAVGLDGAALTRSGQLISALRMEGSSGLLAVDISTGDELWSWRGLPTDQISALEVSADELIVMTADKTGRIVLWSVAGGENLAEVNVGQPVLAAALSKDVSRAAVALKDGKVLILDLDALLARN